MSIRFWLSLSLMIALHSVNVRGDEATSTVEEIEHFEKEIAGILEANCLKCHAGAKPKGGLDLTTREAILKGGESGAAVDLQKPAESLLLKAINFDGYEMPPTGQLSPKQIEALTNWVNEGLAWSIDGKALHFEVPREAQAG